MTRVGDIYAYMHICIYYEYVVLVISKLYIYRDINIVMLRMCDIFSYNFVNLLKLTIL
jgi:hypothetical protein